MKYYINYVEGSVARVSSQPCYVLKPQITSDDQTILSLIVCKFNGWRRKNSLNSQAQQQLHSIASSLLWSPPKKLHSWGLTSSRSLITNPSLTSAKRTWTKCSPTPNTSNAGLKAATPSLKSSTTQTTQPNTPTGCGLENSPQWHQSHETKIHYVYW